MRRSFRKYHRFLAPILALPLALTVLTGMLITLIEESPIPIGLSPRLLLDLHTGELFGLEGFYPILNGLGLLGLLVTGLSMTSLLGRKNPSRSN